MADTKNENPASEQTNPSPKEQGPKEGNPVKTPSKGWGGKTLQDWGLIILLVLLILAILLYGK